MAVSALSFVLPQADDVLGLVAANTLITHTYVWNLVTGAFFETSWIKVGIDLCLLFGVSKMVVIESMEQFLLYFAFSLLAASLLSSAYCFSRFIFSGHEDALIIPMYGFSGVLMCLMLLARRTHRSAAVLPQLPALTYHNLPAAFLCLQLVLYAAGLRAMTRDLPFAVVAALFCWSYLRFYYTPSTTDEDFAFVGMFPEVTHIVLVPFTTAFYNVMAVVGLFPALEPAAPQPRSSHHLRAIAPPSQEPSAPSPHPLPVDLVGDRRRAKAMKLLDAKMAELAGREPEGWDDVAGEAPGALAGAGAEDFELSRLKV